MNVIYGTIRIIHFSAEPVRVSVSTWYNEVQTVTRGGGDLLYHEGEVIRRLE